MSKTVVRVVGLMLAIMMMLSFAACTKEVTPEPTTAPAEDAEDAVEDTTEPVEEETYLIGISQPFMGHPIRQAATVLIDEWLLEHDNVEVMVTDGQLNAQKQIADIEDMITREVDLILVAAHQSPTLVGVLREANEAGIPIIAFDRILTDPSVQVAMVVNDDYAAGQSCAQLLADKLDGKGNIVTLQGPAGNTVASLRQDGFMSVIDQYPDMVVIDDQVANFQRVQAIDIFENILQAHSGEIDAVFTHADEMSLGVLKVLKDAGVEGVAVVGIDGQKDALEAVMAGDYYATIRKIVEIQIALDMSMEYLTTGETIPINYLDSVIITADNVEDYYDPDAVF